MNEIFAYIDKVGKRGNVEIRKFKSEEKYYEYLDKYRWTYYCGGSSHSEIKTIISAMAHVRDFIRDAYKERELRLARRYEGELKKLERRLFQLQREKYKKRLKKLKEEIPRLKNKLRVIKWRFCKQRRMS